jgi:hypothetical protein
MKAIILYLFIGVVVFPLLRWLDSRLHEKKRSGFVGAMLKLIDEELRKKGYPDVEDGKTRKVLGIHIREVVIGIVFWPLALLVFISKAFRS